MIRVKACGICGSDKGEHGRERVADRISGHEVSGVVESAGVGVSPEIEEGTEVTLAPLWHCGGCRYCMAGRTSFCLNPTGVLGYGRGGGFADYVTAPAQTIIRKPADISFHAAAMTEPLAVAVRGVSLVDVTGHECVVFGAGTIGLLLAQVLRAKNARTISVVDIDEAHLEVARAMGFKTVHSSDDAQWSTLAESSPRVAFDAVGKVPDVTRKVVEVVAPGGSCVLIGQQDPDVLRESGFEKKNVSLLYSTGVHLFELEESLRLMRTGDVDVGPLITGVYPLEEIDAAFEAARAGIKVMIEP